MSNSLLRQSLQFVEGEEVNKYPKRNKKTISSERNKQEYRNLCKIRKQRNQDCRKVIVSSSDRIEDNLKKLQYLSNKTTDDKITEKIVERALKGKPLADKITLQSEKNSETVFTEEDFIKFEKEYFCS